MRAAAFALLGLVACQTQPSPVATSGSGYLQERAVAVVTERRQGGRLVAIGASGDRLFEVAQAPQTVAVDQAVSISPDGKRLAFASTRGRSDMRHTSIWVVPFSESAAGAPIPHRITTGASTDTDPVWLADNATVVFASNRAGTFDLWQVSVAADGTASQPVQLTSAPGDELMPAVRADGAIAYAAIVRAADGAAQSLIEVRAADGTIVPWTFGPADTTPAFGATGLYISTPHLREGERVDADIAYVSAPGAKPAWVMDVGGTDESGPTLSADERWLFATSVVRGEGGKPAWSSVVHLDRKEVPPQTRMAVDRAGAVIRSAPAALAGPHDATLLHRNPGYLDELLRIHADLKARAKAAPASPADPQ